ncbi:MAG TPA: DUF177 domain-containing protein [Thermoflexia bacterium]|nr:MAG: hypothetical protein DRI80_06145 [Chloroflexota bacterium]HEY67248.1 DUF177 domain-containing protein [Thermoflexia bacterium]
MIRFDVSALTQARLGTSLTLNVDIGPQSLTDLEVDFLRGTVRVIRVQGGLLVQGTVETQVWLECVRCLDSFALPITLELEETFGLSGASRRQDVTYVVSDDGWLDLTPLLREQAWVALPMKPLCRPDCKGLCPQCGANLNLESCTCESVKIDPRLALLKDLL